MVSTSFVPILRPLPFLAQLYLQIAGLDDIMKIMPCAEGDRSDCQPQANVRCWRLQAVVAVKC